MCDRCEHLVEDLRSATKGSHIVCDQQWSYPLTTPISFSESVQPLIVFPIARDLKKSNNVTPSISALLYLDIHSSSCQPNSVGESSSQ